MATKGKTRKAVPITDEQVQQALTGARNELREKEARAKELERELDSTRQDISLLQAVLDDCAKDHASDLPNLPK